jgi:hypothetical protein
MAPLGGRLDIFVKTVTGSRVQARSLQVRAGRFSQDLDLSALPRSLYMLEIKNADLPILNSLVGN